MSDSNYMHICMDYPVTDHQMTDVTDDHETAFKVRVTSFFRKVPHDFMSVFNSNCMSTPSVA